jgi:hypothetical protein
VIHEDVMMRLFVSSFGMKQLDWDKHCGSPKSITSINLFFEIFFKRWGPPFQYYKSVLNDHVATLQENKEDEVLETMKIEETLAFPIDEDLRITS